MATVVYTFVALLLNIVSPVLYSFDLKEIIKQNKRWTQHFLASMNPQEEVISKLYFFLISKKYIFVCTVHCARLGMSRFLISFAWIIIIGCLNCLYSLLVIYNSLVLGGFCLLISYVVLLQEKKLLDMPKLLDICAIYGHENEDLTRNLV